MSDRVDFCVFVRHRKDRVRVAGVGSGEDSVRPVRVSAIYCLGGTGLRPVCVRRGNVPTLPMSL